MKKIILTVFLGLVSCTQVMNVNDSGKIYIRPSDLNLTSNKYNKKVISVKGFLQSSPEETALWDSKLSSKGEDISKCISVRYLKSDEKLIQAANNDMTILKGTFYSSIDEISDSNDVFLGLCNVSVIVVKSIRKAPTNQ